MHIKMSSANGRTFRPSLIKSMYLLVPNRERRQIRTWMDGYKVSNLY